ncbi:MAG: hypothetical protein H7123_09860 [Thermoleophilia bacterium]|nr:hypothetical protein [Thermoleophilia bacterium]
MDPQALSSNTLLASKQPGEHHSKDRTDSGATVYHWASRVGLSQDALDYGRMFAAIPDARQNGRLGKLLYSMTPVIGPGANTAVVPYETGMWKTAYRTSNVLGTMMTAVNATIAAPNIAAGWNEGGGPAGLYNTKAGRTGMIAAIGPAISITTMTIGMIAAHSAGARGWAVLRGAIDSPLRQNFQLGMIGVALSPIMIGNEAGVFDFADHNSDVGFSESVRTGVKNVPHSIGHIFLGT